MKGKYCLPSGMYYVYDVDWGSECGIHPCFPALYQWIRKILLNIQQASWSCNFFFARSFVLTCCILLVYSRRSYSKMHYATYVRSYFGLFYSVQMFCRISFARNKKYNIFSLEEYCVLAIITREQIEIILFKNVSVFDCIDIIPCGTLQLENFLYASGTNRKGIVDFFWYLGEMWGYLMKYLQQIKWKIFCR